MPHNDEVMSDKEWAAQRDAETLAEARLIMKDVTRLNAARAAAENLAVEKLDFVKDLLEAAGVPFSQVVKGLEIKEPPTQFNPNSQRST